MTLDDIANAPGGFLPVHPYRAMPFATQDEVLRGHITVDRVAGVLGLRLTQAGRDALDARWAAEMVRGDEEASGAASDALTRLQGAGARKAWAVVDAAVELVDQAEMPGAPDALVDAAARTLRRAVAELRGYKVPFAADFVAGSGSV